MAKSFTGTLDTVSHKWRRLAERRQAHLVELFHSGRWKHYYTTEERFLRSMRDAVSLTERWAMIAPPATEIAHQDMATSEATPSSPQRDAA